MIAPAFSTLKQPDLGRIAAATTVAGIDIGGTKVLCGVSAIDHDEVVSKAVPTTTDGSEAIVEQIIELILEFTAVANLAQVVIGVPASVCPGTEELSFCSNLDLSGGRAFKERISARLSGCPVLIENDVNVAAFGEAGAGPAPSADSLAFLSFGTGVGLGLVENGRIWRGFRGCAGEIAYLPVGDKPHLAARGSLAGLFEDRVGSYAIRRRYGTKGHSVREIFRRAETGEEKARDLIDAVARDAAVGVGCIQSLLDPERIVIGGGIGVQPIFVNALKTHVDALVPHASNIEIARLGQQAGMQGALRLAAILAQQHS